MGGQFQGQVVVTRTQRGRLLIGHGQPDFCGSEPSRMYIAGMLRTLVALSVFLISSGTSFAESFSGSVVAIADGDTITVLSFGRGERIRLSGIDCPENGQDFGARAKQLTSALAFKKIVQVNPQTTDRYGRTVAEVLLPDGSSLNQALVSQGMCWWFRKYAPNDTILRDLENEARTAKRGLWVQPDPVPPWEFRANGNRRYPAIAPQATEQQPSSIIGNKKSRIYHWSTCPNYNDVSPKNRVNFESQEAAEAAGFRPAKNCR